MQLKSFFSITENNLPMILLYKGKEYFLKYTSKNKLHMSRNKDISYIDNGPKMDYNNNVKGDVTEDER